MVKNQAEEIRTYLLAKIPVHPKNIVAKASKAYACSRTTVHRHLNRLIRDGKIIKTGTTRQVQYYLKSEKNKEIHVALKPGLEEHKVWQENFVTDFETLPKNVRDICEHGFLEMLNNAIDHSEGTGVIISTEWESDLVRVTISDNGIGIFRKIKNALNLEDERESALHLSKGKFTTDEENHTGEGVFFTSRAFDNFYMSSGGTTYIRDNLDGDWFLKRADDLNLKGTYLSMTINQDSTRKLQDVFEEYTEENSEGILGFNKTNIIVMLSKLGDERYVSRSQARRICLGLEKFNHVVLDFKDISTVGQG
ncbi:MAG: sensor histidine kinase, partial [Nitrospinae bacterium]|nr:sensor histidine kinase [Nitrospinota bacterium]